eukprot:g47636.t1
MPFLGQDWRSPGGYWVKSEDGWKRFEFYRDDDDDEEEESESSSNRRQLEIGQFDIIVGRMRLLQSLQGILRMTLVLSIVDSVSLVRVSSWRR